MRLDGLEISCGDLVTFSATSTDLAFLVVEIYQHACEISENSVVKLTEDFRDGPLEKLWGGGGGGEFSSHRNFFCYQILCMNFFLRPYHEYFLGLIGMHEFFFPLIFSCVNIFLVLCLPHA